MTTAHIERATLIACARGWIGTPYCHQASVRGAGADCLGLLRGLWRECIGPEPVSVPPYSPDWAETSDADSLLRAARGLLIETEPSTARPGDVLLFRWKRGAGAKHVALLASPTRIIHAYEGAGVVCSALGPWRSRIAHAFQFPGVID